MTAHYPIPHGLGPIASHSPDLTSRPSRPPLAGPLKLKTDTPQPERLPSFRQLSKIADAAGDDVSRPVQYPAPAQQVYPAPPITSPSPNLAHPPYQHGTMVSPGMPYSHGPQISPTSVQTDPFYATSPPNFLPSAQGGYHARRQSYPIPSHQYPPPLHSMTTGSSASGDSYSGHHSSLGDISTAQTTPLDPPGQPDNESA